VSSSAEALSLSNIRQRRNSQIVVDELELASRDLHTSAFPVPLDSERRNFRSEVQTSNRPQPASASRATARATGGSPSVERRTDWQRPISPRSMSSQTSGISRSSNSEEVMRFLTGAGIQPRRPPPMPRPPLLGRRTRPQ